MTVDINARPFVIVVKKRGRTPDELSLHLCEIKYKGLNKRSNRKRDRKSAIYL